MPPARSIVIILRRHDVRISGAIQKRRKTDQGKTNSLTRVKSSAAAVYNYIRSIILIDRELAVRRQNIFPWLLNLERLIPS